MEIIYLVIALVGGFIVAWLISSSKIKKLSNENSKLSERSGMLEKEKENQALELKQERNKVIELSTSLSSLKSDYSNQKAEIEKLQEKFTKEFENLANKIFEEKSTKFTEQNKEKLSEILNPLREKISGLVKGREYVVQESITAESGRRFQPDVIIKLPENKSIVIDSKVSLVGYEKFVSSENENEKQLGLREHINSIRSHIKNLSGKNYQNLYQLESLDFVLMFMPIEPAFAYAVQSDASLFTDAFEQNIVIVSPSTLLATLRTIASIWRQEKQ